MDCNIFRKKLPDLVEDNISFDMKEAMLQHICECEACRAIYEDELAVDEILKKGLSVRPESFRSLRSDIMKNIDKNKYGKSPIKRLIYHFKKYKGTYTSMAAVIAIGIFITPYIVKNGLVGSMKKAEDFNVANKPSAAAKDSMENSSLAMERSTEAPRIEGFAEKKSESIVARNENHREYTPKFEKIALDKNFTPVFNTSWEESLSKKYSATVEGKGYEALEEGIANIIVKEVNTGSQWSYNLLESEQKQFTPIRVKWIDDENLLVIIGFGYGTIDLGGELYILNINTAQCRKVDAQQSLILNDKSQITKINSITMESENKFIANVEVLVYDDDNYITSHREEGKVYFKLE
jgi:hypothetical protein